MYTKKLFYRSFLAALILVILGATDYSNAQDTGRTQSAGSGRYIGLRHGPKLPAGLKEVGGGLITDPYKDKVQFGIAHLTRGRTNMLWFELGTHHDAAGHAFWEVLDVITLPVMNRNQILFYTLCLFNDQPDPEIAAIVQPLRRGGYETRTLRAWRANRKTRKFEEAPAKSVKCEMQGDY